jgi:hypothetical protein
VNGYVISIMIASVLSLIPVRATNAQAYCALRDPVRQVYELYPGATSYRSIVRVVGEDARQAVGERLPIELHFNELGRHTVYVAMKDREFIGLVHVRSERSDWGLVEVAWALSLDLKIMDFVFQRCRNSHRAEIESEQFRNQLRGRDLNDIGSMIRTPGSEIIPGKLRVPAGAEGLAAAVVRCALKTIVVTDIVWRSDLERLLIQKKVMATFPRSKKL